MARPPAHPADPAFMRYQQSYYFHKDAEEAALAAVADFDAKAERASRPRTSEDGTFSFPPPSTDSDFYRAEAEKKREEAATHRALKEQYNPFPQTPDHVERAGAEQDAAAPQPVRPGSIGVLGNEMSWDKRQAEIRSQDVEKAESDLQTYAAGRQAQLASQHTISPARYEALQPNAASGPPHITPEHQAEIDAIRSLQPPEPPAENPDHAQSLTRGR